MISAGCRTNEMNGRVRQFEVNAAMATRTRPAASLNDVELGPEAPPAALPATRTGSRLQEVLISVGIAVGIVTVIGVLLVVDPF
jgi:hypothetical protein